MREPVTFVAYKDGVVVSRQLTYSVQTYANKNANAADAKLAHLVDAMMKYGDAVYAYVN